LPSRAELVKGAGQGSALKNKRKIPFARHLVLVLGPKWKLRFKPTSGILLRRKEKFDEMEGKRVKILRMPTAISVAALAIVITALTAGARAQESVELRVEPLRESQYNIHFHILRANTAAGRAALPEPPESFAAQAEAANTQYSAIVAVPPPGFYEGDVTPVTGKATLGSTTFEPIYVGWTGVSTCTNGSCWGNPGAFLKDLAASDNTATGFIHLTDQYTHLTSSGRYALDTTHNPNYTFNFTGVNDCGIGGTNPCVSDARIQAFVNFAATMVVHAAGYTHFFHVFLPKNVDECTNFGCYSPDVPRHFVFCAYHSAANVSAGHIIYSVEPFDNVPGCATAPPASVNGQLADSTDSVLSHETFEAISDPDINTNHDFKCAALFGQEIGDICQGPFRNSSGTFVGEIVPTRVINGHTYKSQLEYSNTYHACAAGP
jgi:hypothetical protein